MTPSFFAEGGKLSFSAIIRQTGEVSIVDLTGQLTSFASGALRDTIGGLMKQGRKRIVLNVGGLLYLDSSGVGELVNCYMGVIKQGGEMKVVGLTPKVEEDSEDHATLPNLPGISRRRRSAAQLPRGTQKRKRLTAREQRNPPSGSV